MAHSQHYLRIVRHLLFLALGGDDLIRGPHCLFFAVYRHICELEVATTLASAAVRLLMLAI
jgi:hypothetical protein